MELLICGSAAAEAWPAVFCVCGACSKARERGGKDIRSRTAYMLDDRIRVDFGPDSVLHQQKYDLDYGRLDHLLISHSHDDHWWPADVSYRRHGFSAVDEQRPLHLWGNAKVRQRFVDVAGADWDRYFLEYHLIRPWQPMDLGNGVNTTPILAAHDPGEQCANYMFEVGGKVLLLGNDTGWYPDETWEFLSGKPLNVVILDCTYGAENSSRGHMGCSWVVRARDELAKRGALASDATVVANHFSHNGRLVHEELERYFAPHEILVAYDGMRLQF